MSSLKDQLHAGFIEYREELVPLTHPQRPQFTVYAATIVDADRIRALTNQAEKGKKPAWWLNATLIAEQTRRIVLNGEELRDDDGDLATFRTQEVMELVGAQTVAEAVRGWYGSDIFLSKVAETLMESSGFDDEVEVEKDPTPAA